MIGHFSEPFDNELYHIRDILTAGKDEPEVYIRPSLEREFRKMIWEEIKRHESGETEPKPVPDREEKHH